MGAIDGFLEYARRQIGKPVRWTAKGDYFVNNNGMVEHFGGKDTAFDCSGLVTCGLVEAGYPDMRDKWHAQRMAELFLPVSKPKRGDLAFYGGRPGGITHVAIVDEGGKIISADGATPNAPGGALRNAKVNVHPGINFRSDFVSYGQNPLYSRTNAVSNVIALGRGPIMSEPVNQANQVKAVSPTGTPVIPPSWTPWITAVVFCAGVVLSLPTMGIALPHVVVVIATMILGIGASLGVASPGIRKQE